MDGRPNRRNKAAFSNFFGVVWTRPKKVVVKIQRIETYSEIPLIPSPMGHKNLTCYKIKLVMLTSDHKLQ